MELDRARIVDQNFQHRIKTGHFPQAKSATHRTQVDCSDELLIDIFKSQIESRQLDLVSRLLKKQNKSFYTIGSSGHESNSAIAAVFSVKDMAFLHYRSSAFMLQRGRQLDGNPRLSDHLRAVVASKFDPIASGRHKVFGSLELNVPPQTSTIASHLPKALGVAFSIFLSKTIKVKQVLDHDAVVLCSFGDASVNHSTAQGALNAALWIDDHHLPLPVVWICEDNGIGVSVPTRDTWVTSMLKSRWGDNYISCDGLNFIDVLLKSKQAEQIARKKRKPVFLHMKTVRLLGHAGSDIEQHYHSEKQIDKVENDDPLLHSSRILIENNLLTQDEVLSIYQETANKLIALAVNIAEEEKLDNKAEIMSSLIPMPKTTLKRPWTKSQKKIDNAKKNLNLAQSINCTLSDLLEEYPNIVLFGEDVGIKGGVYQVTAGLQKTFGAKRIFDTLLDEQTILGTAMGLAHNGFLPIPEIQFLAYIHNAIDQLRGEAATLSFFSNGQFTNPMVIRLPGLAYQRGFGGHFHNDNAIGFLREIPGIIIACPSGSWEAPQLLRSCVMLAEAHQRIVVFLEPIALYFQKDLLSADDHLWLADYQVESEIPFGQMHLSGQDMASEDLLIITYGNGYFLSKKIEERIFDHYQYRVKILNLRWLKPLNIKGIIDVCQGIKRILIVDEGRKTGSLSEELFTILIENLSPLPQLKRITGEDCFIPLGTAWQAILPSEKAILEVVGSFG